MIFRYVVNNKQVLFIVCDLVIVPKGIINALSVTMKQDAEAKTVLALVCFTNSNGLLLHVKRFEKKVDADYAIKAVKEDFQNDAVTFEGVDEVIRRTGKHPREFFEEMLGRL